MAQNASEALLNTGLEPKVVLVAIDASGSADHVVAIAARLIRALPAATLHIVHVFRTSRLDRLPTPNSEVIEEAKEQLEYHVRAARKQCRNEVRPHFLLGDPTNEVLRLASEIQTDLLVVGTHDYRGFERFLLGSIAETIMRKATCSVLIVRRPNLSRMKE